MPTCGQMFHMTCWEMYQNNHCKLQHRAARYAGLLRCPICWQMIQWFGLVFAKKIGFVCWVNVDLVGVGAQIDVRVLVK